MDHIEESPEKTGRSALSRATRWYVIALCFLGAARVFVGAAGLPLFNDVDEQAHFDLIHKYSRGYWPVQRHEYWDRETAAVQAMYGSSEFFKKPETLPGGVFRPPVWTWAASRDRDDYVNRKTTGYTRYMNHEAHSPPVYYFAGAAWYNLGRLIGLSSPQAAYWVRFLNVPLYAVLIAAAFAFCQAYFSPFVARAVPALVAVFPSTIFFAVTSDALSPLLVLLALWSLLRWQDRTAPPTWLSLLAGLLASAAVLVKLTNVAMAAACGIAVLLQWHRARRSGRLREDWHHGALLLLALILPIACWLAQNMLLLGDLTGAGGWMRDLNWQIKPLGEIFNHPLFTLAGQKVYWGKLLTNYYGGDMNWHGRPTMSFTPAMVFYPLSFALLPLALVPVWFRRRRNATGPRRAAGSWCAFLLAASIMFLIFQSLLWDFGTGVFPSRDYPYLSSGRLISGTLVPFFALYACSLEAIFRRRHIARAAALALSVTMMVLPQAELFSKILPSRYNWFHLFVPGSPADAYAGLGFIALDLGRLDAATKSFSLAAEIDPHNVAALANLGNTLAAQGNHDLATQVLTQALTVQPESAELHNSRGAILAEQRSWAAAVADHRAAVELSPQTPLYRFPLAHALSKMGRFAEGEREYALALGSVRHPPPATVPIPLAVPTHPDPAVRRLLAARAVQRAEQANGEDGWSRIELLDNLAVAYSLAGRFEETIATSDLAIRAAEDSGETELAAQFRERQDNYRTWQEFN